LPWIRTECVIDVIQGAAYLGQAVVFLYKAGGDDGDAGVKVAGWGGKHEENLGLKCSTSQIAMGFHFSYSFRCRNTCFSS